MAERTVKDLAGLLLGWAEESPSLVEVARQANGSAGERHGTWFFRLSWNDEQLSRAVEVGISNATALPDSLSTEAFVSVRASASTDSAWVATTIYDRRRSLSRVSDEDLLAWMATAASVAVSYTRSSLSVPYPLNASSGRDDPETDGGQDRRN